MEVRDGILNHRTSGHPSTLEGRIVRLSDKIAYINHDIDDAIRAGILEEEDIPQEYREILGTFHKGAAEYNGPRHHCAQHGKAGYPDVRRRWSEPCRSSAALCLSSVYTNPKAKGEEKKAQNMLEGLFEYYMEHPEDAVGGISGYAGKGDGCRRRSWSAITYPA